MDAVGDLQCHVVQDRGAQVGRVGIAHLAVDNVGDAIHDIEHEGPVEVNGAIIAQCADNFTIVCGLLVEQVVGIEGENVAAHVVTGAATRDKFLIIELHTDRQDGIPGFGIKVNGNIKATVQATCDQLVVGITKVEINTPPECKGL